VVSTDLCLHSITSIVVEVFVTVWKCLLHVDTIYLVFLNVSFSPEHPYTTSTSSVEHAQFSSPLFEPPLLAPEFFFLELPLLLPPLLLFD